MRRHSRPALSVDSPRSGCEIGRSRRFVKIRLGVVTEKRRARGSASSFAKLATPASVGGRDRRDSHRESSESSGSAGISSRERVRSVRHRAGVSSAAHARSTFSRCPAAASAAAGKTTAHAKAPAAARIQNAPLCCGMKSAAPAKHRRDDARAARRSRTRGGWRPRHPPGVARVRGGVLHRRYEESGCDDDEEVGQAATTTEPASRPADAGDARILQ